MKLTQAQRQELRAMFDGRCAYCGDELGKVWHADHVEHVGRRWWLKNAPGVPLDYPERDTLANLMPACPPCNIDKHDMPLESWRQKLQGACGVLQRNQPTYRHAKRFGLVMETGAPIVFYFERQSKNLGSVATPES